jgi:hypothetical protein
MNSSKLVKKKSLHFEILPKSTLVSCKEKSAPDYKKKSKE